MSMVAEARNGNLGSVYPSLFPEGQWSQPIVANMIDIVAKDLSEQIMFLPTIPLPVTQPSMRVLRTKADKRTKIANYYLAKSKMSSEIIRAADQLITFGFVPLRAWSRTSRTVLHQRRVLDGHLLGSGPLR